MALSNFITERGLVVNEKVWLLADSGLPGTPGTDSTAAPVGSWYSDEATGSTYMKVGVGEGFEKWSPVATSVAPKGLNSVSSLSVLDHVSVDSVQVQKWLVQAVDINNPTSQTAVEVHAYHNGTATADATEIQYNIYSKLRTGQPINGLDIEVVLGGAGVTQQMNLRVNSGVPTDFVAMRIHTGGMVSGYTALDLNTVPYDVPMSIQGLPAADTTVGYFAPSRAFNIPENFLNGQAYALTPATAPAVFTINKLNGSTGLGLTVGTVTFAAGSRVGIFSVSPRTLVMAGETIQVISPSTQDATLSDVAITIQGNYAGSTLWDGGSTIWDA